MERLRNLLVVVLLIGACACSPAEEAPSALASLPGPATTTTAVTTTVAPAATTSTSTSTTTTVPVLDRSAPAAIARMRDDLRFLLAVGPRLSGSPAEALAAHYFASTAEAITGEPARLQDFPLPGRDLSQNVWAAEVGDGDRVLLVGAHLDTWKGSPGADDNGSGVIVALELLRRLAERPPANLRVLVIGFGAEEWVGDHDHHIGSQAVAAEMVADGTLPDWMISVDMCGFGPRIQSVDLADHDPSLADAIAEVGRSAGYEVERNTRGEISDHDSFAKVGVPAALLMRRGNPQYHTPAEVDVRDDALLETLAVLEAVVAHLDGDGD